MAAVHISLDIKAAAAERKSPSVIHSDILMSSRTTLNSAQPLAFTAHLGLQSVWSAGCLMSWKVFETKAQWSTHVSGASRSDINEYWGSELCLGQNRKPSGWCDQWKKEKKEPFMTVHTSPGETVRGFTGQVSHYCCTFEVFQGRLFPKIGVLYNISKVGEAAQKAAQLSGTGQAG